jgi:hypothetical protein
MATSSLLTLKELNDTVVLNASQYLQLGKDIAAAQSQALFAGLLIGAVAGIIGILASQWYLRRKGDGA